MIAGNAAISMAGNAAGQIKDKGFKDFDFVDMAIDGAIGAVAGKAGGRGANYGNAKAAMSLGKQVTKRVVSAATHGKLTKTVFKKSVSNYLKNMCAIGGV